MPVCISAYVAELYVEMVLYKTMEVYVVLVCFAVFFYFVFIVYGITLPFLEIRSTVLVSQCAECRVWNKPVAVVADEFLVSFTCRSLFSCLGECFSQKTCLFFVDTFVVYLRELIQLFLQGFVFFVLFDSCSREADELRMQGKN